MGPHVELGIYKNQDGIEKTPGCHPTPGMLHQTTGAARRRFEVWRRARARGKSFDPEFPSAGSEWLMGKLKPTTTGSLLLSVHMPSGQVSTYKVNSSDTILSLKEKVGATAICDGLRDQPKGKEAVRGDGGRGAGTAALGNRDETEREATAPTTTQRTATARTTRADTCGGQAHRGQ